MRNENDIPELIPFDERYPSPESLFRSPEDMNNEQFELLAAAWAEGDLDADSLSEIESVFQNDPSKRALAEEFKKIRLVPGKEKWHNRNTLLKTAPPVIILKRVMLGSMAAAALFLALITLRPLLEKEASVGGPVILPGIEITAAKQESVIPVIHNTRKSIVKTNDAVATDHVSGPAVSGGGSFSRTMPVVIGGNPEMTRLISGINPDDLISIPTYTIAVDPLNDPRDVNWIMKSLTALSKIIAKEDKPVDGYQIAGACVKGINTVLGWEMDLEKVMSDDGELKALSFSSSLLSFTSPVKKNIRVP